MNIEVGGEYVTRDGMPMRVLCVDAPGSLQVVAMDEAGNIHRYLPDGTYLHSGKESSSDLIPVPKKHTRKFRVVHWTTGGDGFFDWDEISDEWKRRHRHLILAITSHEITFTEGDGLPRKGE